MSYWYHVETRTVGKLDVELSWAEEVTPLDDAFDPDCTDIEEMKERCEQFIDTHYIARVRALYNGREYGESILGSCYASNCSPEDNMLSGIDGYLPQMIDEAVKEAERALARVAKEFA